ncbi:MAG: hypothetical protein IPL62_07790 [Caulobacteraceae bacterium]|nr:hypothetical protein [Caulobacteraceae bacterium]
MSRTPPPLPPPGPYFIISASSACIPPFKAKAPAKLCSITFCERSRADPKSRGVYLETANPASLQFYYKNGFELCGEGNLDGAPLWCVYKRT